MRFRVRQRLNLQITVGLKSYMSAVAKQQTVSAEMFAERLRKTLREFSGRQIPGHETRVAAVQNIPKEDFFPLFCKVEDLRQQFGDVIGFYGWDIHIRPLLAVPFGLPVSYAPKQPIPR